MDNEAVRQWLDVEWAKALAEADQEPDPVVDRLANSELVAVRYALVTQPLGKIADPRRSLTAIQAGATGPGAWNPRTFSTKVVVPWVAENQHVLGTSAEPYASKPLRRTHLATDMPDVRDKAEWNRLVAHLEQLDQLTPPELEEEFRRILRSLVRRLARLQFSYSIPGRVSLDQVDSLLADFLSEPSGGLRAMVISAALLRTLGEAFSLFSDVQAQGVNEADAAAGRPGDIMCYSDGELRLVVEVKDTRLTLAHVQDSSRKAKESSEAFSDLLFASRGVQERDSDAIESFIQRDWAAGLNIYAVEIESLARASFVLLKEEWRVCFLREVGRELDRRQDQSSRLAWRDLLLRLGS